MPCAPAIRGEAKKGQVSARSKEMGRFAFNKRKREEYEMDVDEECVAMSDDDNYEKPIYSFTIKRVKGNSRYV